MHHLVPPPDILPSRWAEKNIKIPVGNAIPGPINFDNAPYQRGMIDAIKEYGVRRITYMTGAQLGKTQFNSVRQVISLLMSLNHKYLYSQHKVTYKHS